MKHFKNQKERRGKVLAGIILIGIGCLLLLKQFGFYFPSWLLSWPMILIIIGLYIGTKRQFKTPAPFILIGIGVIFLFKRFFYFDANIVWPVVIIITGIWLIFFRGRNKNLGRSEFDWDKRSDSSGNIDPELDTSFTKEAYEGAYSDDVIDSTSIFGGVKKNILSKNFKGGDIVNFFGGSEINLMHADIQTQAVLDVTQVFGGTKIIVPSNWIVKSEMVAIFGGIEDRRPTYNQDQVQKVLIIKGTSIFAGIDIKSY